VFDFGSGPVPARDRLVELAKRRRESGDKVIPWGIQYLDDQLRGIMPSDLVLVGASSGAGKTTIGVLMAQHAASTGKQVAHFALEAHLSEIEQRMVYREVTKLAWDRDVKGRAQFSFADWVHGMAPKTIHDLDFEAMEIVSGRCEGIRTFYRGAEFTAADITREFLAVQSWANLIVFDHCHYVDSRDHNDNRALKDVAKALRDCALVTGIPVIAIAHLRKRGTGDRSKAIIPSLDDFHGSSDLGKIATRAITLAPARNLESATPGMAPTYIRVEKDRWNGVQGYGALVDFNLHRLQYESEYLLGKFNWNDDKFEQVTDRPWWASRHAKTKGVR
jgi:replicative DNA helicase